MNTRKALLIATVAHGAIGQKRADGVTPYITHPRRVAACVSLYVPPKDLEDAQVVALLHDVVEDTHLTLNDLADLGCTDLQLDAIDRMTKPDSNPADAAYYARVMGNPISAAVKAADRRANLEDALREIKEGRDLERWTRYATKTENMVIPLYADQPLMQGPLIGLVAMMRVELFLR